MVYVPVDGSVKKLLPQGICELKPLQSSLDATTVLLGPTRFKYVSKLASSRMFTPCPAVPEKVYRLPFAPERNCAGQPAVSVPFSVTGGLIAWVAGQLLPATANVSV